MTWVKSQPELPAKMAADDLSEAAALAHFQAISWICGTERFDCIIPRRLVRVALPLTEDHAAVTEELTAARYWHRHGNGDVELIDHSGVVRQSMVTVQKKRATDAKAAKTYREKNPPSVTDAAASPSTVSGPRLPTELTTRQEEEAVPTQRRSARRWTDGYD